LPLRTALRLLSVGLWPVVIRPGSKAPLGERWGAERPTEDSLRAIYAAHPDAGLGIRLGPEAGVLDVEVDGPEGEASLRQLMGGEPPPTIGWSSARGPHHLFRYDHRLARYGKSIIKLPGLPGLEVRIGGSGKQLQSNCPPTVGDDGQPRRWNGCNTIAELPTAVYATLDRALIRPTTPAAAPDTIGSYAAAALEQECQAVATATEGTRNETLVRAAFNVGTLIGAGALEEPAALLNLQAAAQQCGLPETEAARTIRSGLEAGKAHPRDLSGIGIHQRAASSPSRNGLAAAGSQPSEKRTCGATADTTLPPIPYADLDDDDLGLTRANDITAEPIRWLWPYRLARGTMAMVAGDGGIGKSLVLLWIAARVSRGEPWGDKSGNATAGDVIILSAEDRPEDTIVPRLKAMGADLSRITIMRARVVIRRKGKEPTVSPMTFQDRAYWREVFKRRPDCVLFIVDPLASYLGRNVSDARNNEVRGVLEPFLSEIIEPRGVCMLCNSHLNKSIDARTPTHRILGSIAFAALPRNVHLVVRDPENEARRIFVQAKCNNAPDDLPALAYAVERREVVTDAGEVIETAVPIFEAEPVEVRLADLMGSKRSREAIQDQIDRATEWLGKRLVKGPVGSILCAQEGDKFLGRTWPDSKTPLPTEEREKFVLGRVKWWRVTILKDRLGGSSNEVGFHGVWMFRLPNHAWPPDDDAVKAAQQAAEAAMNPRTREVASVASVDPVEPAQKPQKIDLAAVPDPAVEEGDV
jgi:hypothetical protein